VIALTAALATACGKAKTPIVTNSSVNIAPDAFDLSLRGVAFARSAEGRITARGTASHLDYRRAGGQLNAEVTAMTLVPQPGSRLATFGLLHFTAPHVKGEVQAKHGDAWGGVRFESARGDNGATDEVEYDGDQITSGKPVALAGPGYTMHGNGMILQADGSAMRLTNAVTGTLEAR
jgi:lipopolysaccharide export system protein LptC